MSRPAASKRADRRSMKSTTARTRRVCVDLQPLRDIRARIAAGQTRAAHERVDSEVDKTAGKKADQETHCGSDPADPASERTCAATAGAVQGIAIKGRGAVSNVAGRYESHHRELIDDGWSSLDEVPENPKVRETLDASKTVITRNTSPDIPFDRSINPYRGCEHGCVYCFARPTHAWLGLSPGLDFETRLTYKPDAPERLVEELAALRYVKRPVQPINLGTNTDPYQPIERRHRITRRILEVLNDCNHPVGITTKGTLIERDIDILAEMARRQLVNVAVSLPTLNNDLSRTLEPRAAAPSRRVRTIRLLAEAGIPVSVLVAPVIPLLSDGEIEHILSVSAAAGASAAGYVLLRLPLEVRDLFVQWLRVHEPGKADHVMSLVRETRGGRDYQSEWGVRQRGTGAYARLLESRFRNALRKQHMTARLAEPDCSQFVAPRRARDSARRASRQSGRAVSDAQMTLFQL